MYVINGTSINASIVTEEKKEDAIVLLNASVAEDGKLNINQYIQDSDAYNANYEMISKDMAAFNLYVKDKLLSKQ